MEDMGGIRVHTILEYFDASNVDNLKVGEELYGERRQLVTGAGCVCACAYQGYVSE